MGGMSSGSSESSASARPVPDDLRLIGLTPDDAGRVEVLEDEAWFDTDPHVDAATRTESLDWSRARAFEYVGQPRPGEKTPAQAPLAGLYADWPLTLTAPGPGATLTRLPMTGLTWVCVSPNHRRRGALTHMIADHLERARGTEEVISGLHASEPAIYGRYGYGVASYDIEYALGRGTEFTAPEPVATAADRVTTRLVRASDASDAIQEVHLATAAHTLGAVTRDAVLARSWFNDHPLSRGRKEPWRAVLAERDGRAVGYAVVRRISKWSDGNLPDGQVEVPELGAVDPAALLALGRRLVDLDLTTKVKLWYRSLDDPLLWWAGGPRAVGAKVCDAVWIRPVEVDRALEARGYAAPCDVVLDIVDDTCAWNAGRWRLRIAEDGTARCRRTDDAADLRVPVAAIGAAFLGGRSLASLAALGDVVEHTAGALTALSRAMRADVQPLGGTQF